MTQHENDVIKELFKLYRLSLINYCIRKHNFSKVDAEDFVSETFYRLSENIKKVSYSLPAEQRSWLFSTLENVISEYRRKQIRIVKESFEAFEPFLESKESSDQIVEDVAYDEIVEYLKSQLTSSEKICFEKLVHGELTYKEMAESLNINYNTFKYRMRTAFPAIKEMALNIAKEQKVSIDNFVNSNSEKK